METWEEGGGRKVKGGGWPRLHVVTTRRVCPGEELCMSYGAQYWEHERSLRRAAEDVAAAVSAAADAAAAADADRREKK